MSAMPQAEIDRITAETEADDKARATAMPTECDAIRVMFSAWQRLKELGWNDACYCPKDGSEFSTIEVGSTGIHCTRYIGEWASGHFETYDGDIWISHPILWRPRKPSDPYVDLGPCMGPRA